MNKKELFNLIIRKQSFLCIGLDTDIHLIPKHLLKYPDPVFEFNKAIIDATRHLAIAYKPNMAFYESMGIKGWQSLEKTMNYLNAMKDEVFTIADAKRADIGNTSKMYAKAFFEWLNFDAITVAPYMGHDSIAPFLEYEGRWVILLALTSNKGSADFQFLDTKHGKLYEQVIKKAQQWASPEQLMFVAGATHPDEFRSIRKIAPHHFYLVPGIGAQGGDIEKICKNGLNDECGLIINSSRGILYASSGEDFADKALIAAMNITAKMSAFTKPFSNS